MPSERMQRQIDRLLDQAEAAAAEEDWSRVADCARKALAVDAGNEDAAGFLSMAEGQAGPSQPKEKPSTVTEAPSAPPLPKSFAGGRYSVQSFLGEGGRKRVYLAHDTKLDRDVAFAAIKTDGLDADGITRIRREAQAMGRLGDHPHIVTVFDTGEESGAAGQVEPYIVSQYMAGGEPTRVIDEAERRRLPIADAARIAQGLEHAHKHSIIHRDLKPGNIWLTDAGVVKIGDFGLALSLDRTRMTMQGTMVGTASSR